MSKLDLLLEAERRGILPADKRGLLDEARRRGLVPGGEPQTLSAPIEPRMPSAPSPDGQGMTQGQFDQMAAATKAKDHGGIASTLYRDFIEPWVPNGLPNFSQRGIGERLGDAASFTASVPVRMVTGGKYGAGDVAKYLGAEDTGTTLEAGERDFALNNAKQLESIKNAGDVAMGLPLPVPREPPLPVIARRPKAPPVLPRSVRTRLAEGPGGAADDFLMRKMEEGGLTPQDIRRRMAEGQKAVKFGNSSGALPENMADLMGDTGKRALRGAVVSPGPASAMGRKILFERQTGTANPYAKAKFGSVGEELSTMGQSQRLLDNLARGLGIRSKGTAYQTEKALNAELKAKSAPAYDAAWKNAEDFDIRPAITKAMQEAADMEGPRGAQMQQAIRMFQFPMAKSKFYRPLGKADELKRFDSSKRGLDDMIESAKRAGHNEMAAALTRFKHNLLNDVHGGDRGAPTKNIDYAGARQLYAGGASMRDAIELGRRALREGQEVTVDEFRALSEGEKTMFRLGLFEDAKRVLGNQKTSADATQMFRKRNVAELLREVFPQPKSKKAQTRPSEQFGEIINREAAMHEGMTRIIHNSITAPALQDVKEIGRWAQIAQRLRGQGLISTVVDEATTELVKMLGMHKDVAERVARMLLHTNPKTIEQTLKRLEARYGKAAADEAYFTILNISRNRMRAMLGADVGSRVLANSEPRR